MSYDYLFQKANKLYEAGALQDAERLYRQILQAAPQQANVLNMLGLIAQAQGKHTVAADYFFEALKQVPNHLPLHFNLAVSLAETGHFKQAIQAYEKVIALNPQIKEAYNNLGGIYEKIGQAKNAEKYYQKALEIDSSYIEPAVNLAALNHNIEKLEELGKHYPQSALPFYYLAREYFEQNKLSPAEKYISLAAAQDAHSPEINVMYGQICMDLRNLDKAKKYFYRALHTNPYCLSALINLGILEQQEAFFKQALNLEPDNLQAHIGYADFLSAVDRQLEALEEYRKAVILNPDLPQVSNNLAIILKDLGEYEQALDLFFNAFIKAPELEEISQNIAQTLILLQAQQSERALQIAQNWVNTAPDNLWATQTLAFFKGETTTEQTRYNEILFDAFAENYDRVMKNVKYGIFNELQKHNIRLQGKILDLGCGTGLAAEQLKSAENNFTGVDISQKMLNVAAAKKVYSELKKANIEDFLQKETLNYDWIIAFDVFNYLQKPEELFPRIFPHNLAFTIENTEKAEENTKLMPTGRYRHNPQYIFHHLEQAGYTQIKMFTFTLREENKSPVIGTLFVAEK